MKVQLPTGRVVELVRRKEGGRRSGTGTAETRRLFTAACSLFRNEVTIAAPGGAKIDVDDLALTDFHALRAIAAHEGWLDEEEVEVDCVNCGASIRLKPCHEMPLGPFLEQALDDPELDARLEASVPHAIPAIGSADSIVLRSVTVREAAPFHVALAKEPLVIDEAVVAAMGVVALGDERDARAIATALEEASDEAFEGVARLFVELHYPPRLFGVARCEACGARNDVDAPFDRELSWGDPRPDHAEAAFVRFSAFSARARAIAKDTFDPAHEPMLSLVIEGGVPACDEGGIALLGSYVPGSPGNEMSPSRSHEITVYYRTFRAMWREEGPYDWEDELTETIEHEYEHFLAELGGGDPMDEEERREIADEAIRIHGKSTLLKAEVSHLGTDFAGFLRRTWILWVIILIVALLAALGGGESSGP